MKDYASAENRQRDLERALFAPVGELEKAERAERYAGIVKIERSDRFTITFPDIDFRNPDTKRLLAEVKSLPDRRFDPITKAWGVPLASAEYVEILCESYGLTVEQVAGRDVAELQRQVERLTAELAAAVRLADEYAALLDRTAAA